MRVLYGLFAGLGAGAVAEFLPDGTVPEEGYVSKWRDILLMISANRTPGVDAAVVALGDALKKLGHWRAAQVCYLLAPTGNTISGIDTPEVRAVLLTSDHTTYPASFARSPKAIQATELYEYAQTLIGNAGAANALPYLQAYKIAYAWYLADLGFVEQAGRYVEAVGEVVKTYSRG
ncbi:vesicle coat component, partial [Rhizophlyctis rosea]